jgi:hypothetical protein
MGATLIAGLIIKPPLNLPPLGDFSFVLPAWEDLKRSDLYDYPSLNCYTKKAHPLSINFLFILLIFTVA